ncbi:hypothetical protein BU15DRAFT_35602, partial [Melanogaster broomeanus]
IVSPFPDKSIKQIALAGGMAGFVNAVLASPGTAYSRNHGAVTDQRLRDVARELWREWGFKQGIMRGYWVTVAREIPAYAGTHSNVIHAFYGNSAFEFSKRKFQAHYGQQIPVWALLASGSTGGITYWLSSYHL